MREPVLFCEVHGPAYQLGDLVVFSQFTEDGLLADYGYIKGVESDPTYAVSKGWWYCIHIVSGEYQGIDEWVPETDIQGQVIRGKQGRKREVRFEVGSREIREINPSYGARLG